MKAFLLSLALMVLIAVLAAFVFDGMVSEPVAALHSSDNVRLD
jgi:hypothetical protein